MALGCCFVFFKYSVNNLLMLLSAIQSPGSQQGLLQNFTLLPQGPHAGNSTAQGLTSLSQVDIAHHLSLYVAEALSAPPARSTPLWLENICVYSQKRQSSCPFNSHYYLLPCLSASSKLPAFTKKLIYSEKRSKKHSLRVHMQGCVFWVFLNASVQKDFTNLLIFFCCLTLSLQKTLGRIQ